MRRSVAVVISIVAIVLALWYLVHLSRPPTDSGAAERNGAPRVVIVGVDGLDWALIERVESDVGLPNIERLREQGASGDLLSIYPFISPSIWTSIATGKTEEKHGISGFLVDRGKTVDATPTTSNMRQTTAIWEILSSAGRSVGFIGWLVTWPAEPVTGYMVASYTHFLAKWSMSQGLPAGNAEAFERSTYPAPLYDEIERLRVVPDALGPDEIAFFTGTTEHLDRPDVTALVANLRRIYSGDLTFSRIATHLMKTRPTDLSAVYLRGLDSVCHTFWKYMEPAVWAGGPLSPELVETFAPVIERYYVRVDSIVGVILDTCDESTTVILCSDHGFAGHAGYRGFEGEMATGTDMHRREGVIIIGGPDVIPGAAVENASVLDVVPTVLVLFGLPVARDMDGRPLIEIFEPSFMGGNPVAYIDTYDIDTCEAREVSSDREPITSPVDNEIKERLRSLGYID